MGLLKITVDFQSFVLKNEYNYLNKKKKLQSLTLPHSPRLLILLYNDSYSRIHHLSLSLLHFGLQPPPPLLLLRYFQVMDNVILCSCHSDIRY